MRDRQAWSRGGLVLAVALLASPRMLGATTLGTAEVSVNRIGAQPAHQEISIPASATVFQTPVANLAAVLPPDGTLRSLALAGASIDLPAGVFSGTISTFGRAELPGVPANAYARSSVAIKNTIFEVRSDSLPAGTAVDVRLDLMLTYRANAGVTGIGACCSILNVYDFVIGAGVPFDSSYTWLPPTGQGGVLGGGPDESQLHFGPYTAQAAVGGLFYLDLSFVIESQAIANGVSVQGRNHAGQAEAAASAALFFATEVVPSGAGFAAAARAPAGSTYLFSPIGGFVLPGLEAFDSANVQAHLAPLVQIPEPGTFALLAIGITGLGVVRARRRTGRVSATRGRLRS